MADIKPGGRILNPLWPDTEESPRSTLAAECWGEEWTGSFLEPVPSVTQQ